MSVSGGALDNMAGSNPMVKMVEKKALLGWDPKRPFYLRADENQDHSVDIKDGYENYENLADAIESAKDIAREYGGLYYVIEARVVRIIERKERIIVSDAPIVNQPIQSGKSEGRRMPNKANKALRRAAHLAGKP